VRPYLADPRFTYVSQDNREIAGARNRGIGAARGDWVALLDHDDRWKPCKLERQLGAAAERGWDIVCSDAEVVRDDRRTLSAATCVPTLAWRWSAGRRRTSCSRT